MTPSIASVAKLTAFAIKLGNTALQRWTAYRREQFLQSLLENLQIEQASGDRRDEVDEALDRLLESEESSEVLYDAYRRVCFTRSKNYGPRIVGLLTAELLNNSMTSSEEDEMIFEAAERLNDVQLIDFKRCYACMLEHLGRDTPQGKLLSKSGEEIVEKEVFDEHETGSGTTGVVEILPPDLRATHGAWAALLEDCGIISRSVSQETVQVMEDSERHIDYDQTWVISSATLTYRAEALRLYQLLLRARCEFDEALD
jgi:hypothetical protein